ADRAALLLWKSSDGPDELNVVASRSRPGDEEGLDEEGLEEIMDSWTEMRDVLETGKSCLSTAVASQIRKDWTVIGGAWIRWVMCVPVRTDESVIGVLYADREEQTGGRPVNDLELLALIGYLAGVAIDRAR
ncbi:MAG: GAF domain-containing protein, partial [Gemmatimonadota bacterium]